MKCEPLPPPIFSLAFATAAINPSLLNPTAHSYRTFLYQHFALRWKQTNLLSTPPSHVRTIIFAPTATPSFQELIIPTINMLLLLLHGGSGRGSSSSYMQVVKSAISPPTLGVFLGKFLLLHRPDSFPRHSPVQFLSLLIPFPILPSPSAAVSLPDLKE